MGGPGSLLLDTYTEAAAAYSLRKLKSDYTGKVLQVRRASDHVEVDVGFDSNGLLSLDSPVTNVTEESTGITQGSSTNAAKLGEFCGEARRSGGDTSYATVDSMTEAAHVEVVTWYDQSGNANDASQAVANSQPRIYNRTTGIVTPQSNSNPAIIGDSGNNHHLRTAAISNEFANGYSYFAAVDDIGYNKYPFYYGETNANTSFGMRCLTSESGKHRSDNVKTSPLQRGDTDGLIQSAFYDGGTNVDVYMSHENGTQNSGSNSVSALASTTNGHILTLFARWSSGGTVAGNPINGQVQEIILYNTNRSENRTAIESNINTFYSIY